MSFLQLCAARFLAVYVSTARKQLGIECCAAALSNETQPPITCVYQPYIDEGICDYTGQSHRTPFCQNSAVKATPPPQFAQCSNSRPLLSACRAFAQQLQIKGTITLVRNGRSRWTTQMLIRASSRVAECFGDVATRHFETGLNSARTVRVPSLPSEFSAVTFNLNCRGLVVMSCDSHSRGRGF